MFGLCRALARARRWGQRLLRGAWSPAPLCGYHPQDAISIPLVLTANAFLCPQSMACGRHSICVGHIKGKLNFPLGSGCPVPGLACRVPLRTSSWIPAGHPGQWEKWYISLEAQPPSRLWECRWVGVTEKGPPT